MTNNNLVHPESSSFKDRDALVYSQNDEIYRKIFLSYKDNYNKLIDSGLYKHLTDSNHLIKHTEIENNDCNVYKIIKPEKVFITYPWEWCFSQLKAAAIATLNIQKIALEHGMSLKDANCYNIQFKQNKPVLIDTTSFEIYTEGQTWVAYRQFCENFLAPLALMSYNDLNLNKLLINFINGIPLDLVSKLLPFKTKFNQGLLFHIHLHAKLQGKYSDTKKKQTNLNLTKESQIALLNNLTDCINKLQLKKQYTEWEDYYNFTNYSDSSFEEKKKLILEYKTIVNPKIVWDFGANTGVFSRLFKESADKIVALDIDPLAIEKNYNFAIKNNETNLFPMIYDLANPSPSIGWNNEERVNLQTRAKNVDIVLSLALIHHLRITYNVPFHKMAEYFSQFAPYIIIEFIHKEDSQIKKMLLNREDVFEDYNEENFEKEFGNKYEIVRKDNINGTERILYLMRKI